jgi:glutaredoxin 3
MSAPKVEIYTQWGCPYCVRAKALLDAKGVAYTEIDVTMDTEARRDGRAQAGRAHRAADFRHDVALGGCDDIHALDAAGKLDRCWACKMTRSPCCR